MRLTLTEKREEMENETEVDLGGGPHKIGIKGKKSDENRTKVEALRLASRKENLLRFCFGILPPPRFPF